MCHYSLLSRRLSRPTPEVCGKRPSGHEKCGLAAILSLKNEAKPQRKVRLRHWNIHYCKVSIILKLFATTNCGESTV